MNTIRSRTAWIYLRLDNFSVTSVCVHLLIFIHHLMILEPHAALSWSTDYKLGSLLFWPPRTLLWTVTIKGSSVQGACCLLHQFSSTSIYFPQVEDSLCPLLGASPRYFIFRWQRQANIMVVTNQFTDPAVDYPDNLMLDFIRNLFLNHHYNCIIVY